MATLWCTKPWCDMPRPTTLFGFESCHKRPESQKSYNGVIELVVKLCTQHDIQLALLGAVERYTLAVDPNLHIDDAMWNPARENEIYANIVGAEVSTATIQQPTQSSSSHVAVPATPHQPGWPPSSQPWVPPPPPPPVRPVARATEQTSQAWTDGHTGPSSTTDQIEQSWIHDQMTSKWVDEQIAHARVTTCTVATRSGPQQCMHINTGKGMVVLPPTWVTRGHKFDQQPEVEEVASALRHSEVN